MLAAGQTGVLVPVIVDPIEVQDPLPVIPVEVRDVQVAVGVALIIPCIFRATAH